MDLAELGAFAKVKVSFHNLNTFRNGVFLAGEKVFVHALQYPTVTAVGDTPLVGLLFVDRHFCERDNDVAQRGIVHPVPAVKVDDMWIILPEATTSHSGISFLK